MTKMLIGKVALVTGGARGLGAAIVRGLAEQGADVAFSYVNSAEKSAGIVRDLKALGVRGAAFQADQADRVAAAKLVSDVVERFGRIDILVNNASIDEFGRVDDPNRNEAAFDRFWAVAISGCMATVRAASKVMSDGGRVVLISSNLGSRVGVPGLSDMASIKAALDGYSRGVARDLASRDITVNVVHAGFMKTDLNAQSRDAIAPILEKLCFPRFGTVEEVAAPVLFFASPAASYVTGAIIDCDGGYNV